MGPGTELPLRGRSAERYRRRYKTRARLPAARACVAIVPLGDKCLMLPRVVFKPDAALELAIGLYGLTQAGLGRFLVFHADKE